MVKARKDKRGYVLRTGETQRKDGRYVYTYTNKYGQRKSIYAKTLPELRQKERKSIRDREDGLDPDAADRITLNEMFDKYYSLMREKGLKPVTVENVHTVVHPTLAMAIRDCIIRINPSDEVMAEIKKSKLWVKKKSHAFTISQRKAMYIYLMQLTGQSRISMKPIMQRKQKMRKRKVENRYCFLIFRHIICDIHSVPDFARMKQT